MLEKFKITGRTPKTVLELLRKGARGEIAETPKPGDPLFQNVYNIVAGSNALALAAAARQAHSLGYRPRILSNIVSGEARDVARKHIDILRKVGKRPACLLAGGETTVTVKGRGQGGRNQELALAAAIAMEGSAGRPGIMRRHGWHRRPDRCRRCSGDRQIHHARQTARSRSLKIS